MVEGEKLPAQYSSDKSNENKAAERKSDCSSAVNQGYTGKTRVIGMNNREGGGGVVAGSRERKPARRLRRRDGSNSCRKDARHRPGNAHARAPRKTRQFISDEPPRYVRGLNGLFRDLY